MTAKELIERKTDVLNRKQKTVEVEIRGLGTWKFKIPDLEDFTDADAYMKAHGESGNYALASYLLFNNCLEPDLHDQALQEAYGARGPALIGMIFHPGEVDQLSTILTDAAGFDSKNGGIVVKGAEQIKN